VVKVSSWPREVVNFRKLPWALPNDQAIAEKIRLLRNYGQTQRNTHVIKGYNSRFDELQAAVLLVKLQHLDSWNKRRRAIAKAYSEGLAGTGVLCPREVSGRHHVYHLYVVRVRDRNRFQAQMAARGIATLVHYPIPVHQQEAYMELASEDGCLLITNTVALEVVSLPLYPELEDHEVNSVVAAAKESV